MNTFLEKLTSFAPRSGAGNSGQLSFDDLMRQQLIQSGQGFDSEGFSALFPNGGIPAVTGFEGAGAPNTGAPGVKNKYAALLGDIGTGVGIATDLYGAYLGHKQLGLAKDQFGFNKELGNRNLVAQAKSFNSALEDKANFRNRYARENGLSSAPESTASYLERFGVSDKAI